MKLRTLWQARRRAIKMHKKIQKSLLQIPKEEDEIITYGLGQCTALRDLFDLTVDELK